MESKISHFPYEATREEARVRAHRIRERMEWLEEQQRAHWARMERLGREFGEAVVPPPARMGGVFQETTRLRGVLPRETLLAEDSRPTVLIVDSHDQSRQALADLLRECGYHVLEAHNGLDGLALARAALPELIVLDLWPFFSASLQLVERLRSGRETAAIPVLVVTSVVSEEYRSRARAAGCQGYLEKPCKPDRALAEVRRILRQAREPQIVPTADESATPAA